MLMNYKYNNSPWFRREQCTWLTLTLFWQSQVSRGENPKTERELKRSAEWLNQWLVLTTCPDVWVCSIFNWFYLAAFVQIKIPKRIGKTWRFVTWCCYGGTHIAFLSSWPRNEVVLCPLHCECPLDTHGSRLWFPLSYPRSQHGQQCSLWWDKPPCPSSWLKDGSRASYSTEDSQGG